jgi:hypothetical protein
MAGNVGDVREMLTRFPLVLMPSFLVPLAFALHVIALTQLRPLPRNHQCRTAHMPWL